MTPTSTPSHSSHSSPSSLSRSAASLPRLATLAVLAGLLATTLSACVPLVIGGAAVAGAGLVATDRRTAGTQLEDETIERRAGNAISTSPMEARIHINVTSYNRQVLLTGEAPTAADRQYIEQLVSRVENVRGVVNDIAIAQPTGFADRSRDTLITGQVKASFVDAKDIYANAFKVTTERNTVYLMGRVSQREANRTAEIARGVRGVVKVVRVFELISEQELADLGRQQAPAPTSGSSTPSTVAPLAPMPAPAPPAPSGAVVTPVR